MTNDATPLATDQPQSPTGCGCGSGATRSADAHEPPENAGAAPCCGTREAASAAGACCDPDARTDALATGASCCG
jgi:hypothetical protein